jgi:hypothetical protein
LRKVDFWYRPFEFAWLEMGDLHHREIARPLYIHIVCDIHIVTDMTFKSRMAVCSDMYRKPNFVYYRLTKNIDFLLIILNAVIIMFLTTSIHYHASVMSPKELGFVQVISSWCL